MAPKTPNKEAIAKFLNRLSREDIEFMLENKEYPAIKLSKGEMEMLGGGSEPPGWLMDICKPFIRVGFEVQRWGDYYLLGDKSALKRKLEFE